MKRLKKILALALAMAMVLSMSALSAFADDHTASDTHKLTITPTNTETAHSYEAYQIFKGVLPGDKDTAQTGSGQLNSLAWGDDASGAALITALKADATLKDDFKNAKDAPTVAAVLATYSNDAAKLQAFADVVNANIGSFPKKTGTAEKGKAVEIDGLVDGYYFVKDAANSQDGDSGSYSKYMLKIVGDTAVTAKDTKPSLDKSIKQGENKVDISNGSIGDKVEYLVESTVPDMTYYESYKFQIEDTMSKGLTFNDDVAIKIGTDTTLNRVYYNSADQKYYANKDFTGEAVTAGYTVDTTTDATGTKMTIYIVNFIQYKDKKNLAINVTYSATINQDALVTTAEANEGNKNTAKLVYSNNPNDSGKGENGEPKPDTPTGETPEDEVVTYTTGLELIKVDGDDETKKLAGAVFELTGDSKNVVIVNKEIFVAVTEGGTHWRLKDGTYTTQDPNGTVDGKPVDKTTYDSETQKYKKETVVTKDYNATDKKSEAKGVTGADGILEYTGLGEGLYTIEETQAPVGYNKLKDKIYVFVKFDTENKVFKTYKYKGTGTPTAPTGEIDEASWEELAANGATSKVEFDLQVLNNSGAELPSTGGIGTTIFYVVGAILVIGAGVVLITKRRMEA